ncbi:hypothetical protein EPA93_19140 [Ktedonosporobacter rubrisoli]|uniref:Uncharacterized protein n=1 Tax=Ktedonosporobacter rubrisoli TaxID=2509675 RepID=A0A4P6JRS0_KTERU|nr:hypothetical protein [Ktedonosporobacter rubrisoli]QBD77995.1 hypothetical protein EPA93_19140 [Ktedonosporobacter rubrisoli]
MLNEYEQDVSFVSKKEAIRYCDERRKEKENGERFWKYMDEHLLATQSDLPERDIWYEEMIFAYCGFPPIIASRWDGWEVFLDGYTCRQDRIHETVVAQALTKDAALEQAANKIYEMCVACGCAQTVEICSLCPDWTSQYCFCCGYPMCEDHSTIAYRDKALGIMGRVCSVCWQDIEQAYQARLASQKSYSL